MHIHRLFSKDFNFQQFWALHASMLLNSFESKSAWLLWVSSGSLAFALLRYRSSIVSRNNRRYYIHQKQTPQLTSTTGIHSHQDRDPDIDHKFLVVTRIHGSQSIANALDGLLLEFLQSTQSYASHVIICIGALTLDELQRHNHAFQTYIEKYNLEKFVTVYPIYPWGYFTTALNCAVLAAQDMKCSYVAFQVCTCNCITILGLNNSDLVNSSIWLNCLEFRI